MITDFLESGSSLHTVPFGGRHDRFISPVALLISWAGYMRWKESSFSGLGLTYSLKSAESGYRYCILIITLQGLTRHMYPSLPFLLSKITFLFTTLLFPLCSLSYITSFFLSANNFHKHISILRDLPCWKMVSWIHLSVPLSSQTFTMCCLCLPPPFLYFSFVF